MVLIQLTDPPPHKLVISTLLSNTFISIITSSIGMFYVCKDQMKKYFVFVRSVRACYEIFTKT